MRVVAPSLMFPAITVSVCQLRPTSAGTCHITSNDPALQPEIRPNYLSTDQDRREWVEAIRRTREIMEQPALEPFDAGESSPGPSVQTDEEILEWVRADAETALHPSCTAKMGTDDLAVVVNDQDVKGLGGRHGQEVAASGSEPRRLSCGRSTVNSLPSRWSSRLRW